MMRLIFTFLIFLNISLCSAQIKDTCYVEDLVIKDGLYIGADQNVYSGYVKSKKSSSNYIEGAIIEGKKEGVWINKYGTNKEITEYAESHIIIFYYDKDVLLEQVYIKNKEKTSYEPIFGTEKGVKLIYREDGTLKKLILFLPSGSHKILFFDDEENLIGEG